MFNKLATVLFLSLLLTPASATSVTKAAFFEDVLSSLNNFVIGPVVQFVLGISGGDGGLIEPQPTSSGCSCSGVNCLTVCGGITKPCVAGQCVEVDTCEDLTPALGALGYTCCNGVLKNTQYGDLQNCGGCGQSCPSTNPLTTQCLDGECMPLTCSEGGAFDTVCDALYAGQGACCGGSGSGPFAALGCSNLATDPSNCGSCGRTCPGGQCVNGSCQSNPDPSCTDSTDCPLGAECCGGVCTDVANNPLSCGGCGNECGTAEVCAGGACASINCTSAFIVCADLQGLLPATSIDCCAYEGYSLCTPTDTPAACGSCDVECDPGQICNDGACTTFGNGLCEPNSGENCANTLDCACENPANAPPGTTCNTNPSSSGYGQCS